MSPRMVIQRVPVKASTLTVPRLAGECLDIVVVDRRVHQVPPGRHADLALVQERPPRAGRHGPLKVDVSHDLAIHSNTHSIHR
jgi:hypothetical protein